VLERRPEVEVDAADPIAGRCEGDRRSHAHPAGGTEKERPALALVGARPLVGHRRLRS
jgi:hypothetical protein